MLTKKATDQAEIIKLLRMRDCSVMEIVYDQFAAVLYGVVFKITGKEGLAEEALKDTLVFAWNNFHSFDESKQSLCSWLIGIARNRALKEIPQPATGTVSFDNEHNRKNQNDHEVAVSVDARKVLEMVFFKGYKINDISALLGIDETEAAQLLREAVNKYRKELHKK